MIYVYSINFVPLAALSKAGLQGRPRSVNLVYAYFCDCIVIDVHSVTIKFTNWRYYSNTTNAIYRGWTGLLRENVYLYDM
jgi:hypothetical protein